jgi:uncharacterized protein
MKDLATPVQAAQREIFMDVLRGFAILGILIANLNAFTFYFMADKTATGTFLLPEADHTMEFLHQMFIEGKFYSIFSLLFGWGLALQFKRGDAKGIDVLPTVKRRLVFMLLLGALHLCLWQGDIVFFYALLGFILLPLRKLSNKALLITGVVLILSPVVIYAAKMHWQGLNLPAFFMFGTGQQLDASLNGINSEAEFMEYAKDANLWELLRANIPGFFYRFGYLFFTSRIVKVLGVFCIGYVLGRSNFYTNLLQYKKVLYWIIAFGIVLALPANYFLAYYMSNFGPDYFNLGINGLYQTIAYALGVVPLAFTYVALFMLAFQTGAGKKLLSVLAPVGKMAFSNYILHTLIGSFVFLPIGLGYMGQVGPVYYTVFGILVFIFQIIFSTLWLRYFNYGPFEWLWRSGTYGKWQVFWKN